MTSPSDKTTTRDRYGALAPKLVELTEDVLFGDIWERPELSKRDRSLITCAAVIVLYRPEQMEHHFARALTNGVTKEELVELITHLAFYGGWPSSMSAIAIAKRILANG
jgi:4-carboxymuconolactone decarboxylase